MFLEKKAMLCNLQVSNKELILHMDFLFKVFKYLIFLTLAS